MAKIIVLESYAIQFRRVTRIGRGPVPDGQWRTRQVLRHKDEAELVLVSIKKRQGAGCFQWRIQALNPSQ